MAFIDKKDPVVLNIKLTSKGRELLAAGNLKFKYFAIGDSEVDYNFNAETGPVYPSFTPNSLNVLRPVDNNPSLLSFIPSVLSGSPYNIIPTPSKTYVVTNTAKESGFFYNLTNNSFTFNDTLVKQPNVMIEMATGIIDSRTLLLKKSPSHSWNGAEPSVGDLLLVKWTLNGDTTSYVTNKTTPTPFLTYQIVNIVSGSLGADNLRVNVDRDLPDFSTYTHTGLAGAMVFKFTGDTYSTDYVDTSVFLSNSQCDTAMFPFWNMSIIFTEEIAGVQSLDKKFGQFDSSIYGGFVSYIQAQANKNSPTYKNKLGVIHYTNSSPANVYAEGFYINNTISPKLEIPTIMWHKNATATLGATFVAGSGHTLSGLNAHYYDLVDINDPSIIVGKIFDELKLFVIEDQELLFTMSYKSNRSWTVPNYIITGGGGCEEAPTTTTTTTSTTTLPTTTLPTTTLPTTTTSSTTSTSTSTTSTSTSTTSTSTSTTSTSTTTTTTTTTTTLPPSYSIITATCTDKYDGIDWCIGGIIRLLKYPSYTVQAMSNIMYPPQIQHYYNFSNVPAGDYVIDYSSVEFFCQGVDKGGADSANWNIDGSQYGNGFCTASFSADSVSMVCGCPYKF